MTTMRKSIRSGTSHYPPELVFWPKWEVHLSTGEIIPEQRVAPSWQIPLEQNDFEMSDSLLSSSICKPWSTRHFISNYDLMFIHNYVFEHCENPDATIYYIHEDYLPSTINLVEHVAIHASALSIKKDDLDWVWGTQLRFILRNFPNVRSITLVATTVLNTARPPTCPLPYETIDIEAIDVSDRRRLGLDEGPGAVKLCPETQQPGNFVIQTWEDLSRRWPSWSNRKQANTRSPVLTVMGMMCFAEDWHNLDLQGEHGMSCKVVVERLPAALRTVAKQPISGHRVDKKPSVPRIPSIYALQTHDATELGMKGKTALKRAVSSHTHAAEISDTSGR
ncbi:hypothetical protein M406DRAFT_70214 [Cryphonectria parasitica EP155]|uniref:Uncharacterized protein n=1 Tax=Cryphonectria parasitica (strain ATCC 38755 / EP155) TaxID=660469 RepID=A0A9P4Y7F3_CRYP1|nr:uncharacterized protein M406DRAFT_70214 [Cryphonectria parasitica EP155]KAF3768118.1 hypothetical protein M406DRAFT_70214 [Cryphonectria parasitica EP155]